MSSSSALPSCLDDILNVKFIASDWEKLTHNEIKPPWVPATRSPILRSGMLLPAGLPVSRSQDQFPEFTFTSSALAVTPSPAKALRSSTLLRSLNPAKPAALRRFFSRTFRRNDVIATPVKGTLFGPTLSSIQGGERDVPTKAREPPICGATFARLKVPALFHPSPDTAVDIRVHVVIESTAPTRRENCQLPKHSSPPSQSKSPLEKPVCNRKGDNADALNFSEKVGRLMRRLRSRQGA